MKFFNFKWLFFRIKKEIFSPSTFLGKKIMYFIIKKFLVKKNKQSEGTLMIAVYDLNINPITYNFGEFLVLCNNEIKKKNIQGYKIVFIAKKYKNSSYTVLKNHEYESNVDEESQKWRFNNILLPLLSCVGNKCIGYEYIESKKDIKKYWGSCIFFPENYNLKIDVIPNIKNVHKISSLEHIGLSAPKQSLKYITDYLTENNINKRIITITIRYQEHDPLRNANLDSWLKFCSYIESMNYKVIIIPDTDKAWFIKKKFCEFEVFIEGSFNLLLLIALYESAYYNYFTPHGPSTLCHLNKNAKYIMMKSGPINGSIVHTEKAFSHYKSNSNYFYANKKDQILFWKDDNLDNLKESFNMYVL